MASGLEFSLQICAANADFIRVEPRPGKNGMQFSSNQRFVINLQCDYGQLSFEAPPKIEEWLGRAANAAAAAAAAAVATATVAAVPIAAIAPVPPAVVATPDRPSPPARDVKWVGQAEGQPDVEGHSEGAAARVAVLPKPEARAETPPAQRIAAWAPESYAPARPPSPQQQQQQQQKQQKQQQQPPTDVAWVDVKTRAPVISPVVKGSQTLQVCSKEESCGDPGCDRVHGKFEPRQAKRFAVGVQDPLALTMVCAYAYHGRCHHYVDASCVYRHFIRIKGPLENGQLARLDDYAEPNKKRVHAPMKNVVVRS